MHYADINAALHKSGKPSSSIAKELGVSRTAVSNTIHGITSFPIASHIAKTIGKPIEEIWPGKYDHRIAS